MVGNKAHPEGSIAESWIAEELFTFASAYLDDNVETRFNRDKRVSEAPDDPNSDSEVIFSVGTPIAGDKEFTLSEMEMLQAHRHVLVNCPLVEPYIQEYKRELKRKYKGRKKTATDIDKEVHLSFPEWFKDRIDKAVEGYDHPDIVMLARGPKWVAKRYTVYDINGLRFRTLDREQLRKTQNSGVCGTFDIASVSSAGDTNPIRSDMYYYGKLVDIVELNYYGRYTTLFKCKWADTMNPSWRKTDPLGFTKINFSHTRDEGDRDAHEPYISAGDARMVYYVEDK
ncbi:hypothetical protein LINPERPRIM_LOCUS33579, partial [Linum perenne]